jgi:hypothetical protein
LGPNNKGCVGRWSGAPPPPPPPPLAQVPGYGWNTTLIAPSSFFWNIS